ncbi:hypothetical protein DICPUDRAFT_78742 [Dictyostelium purpureum]|uniref:Uncharacterized protein n=1 Tax=Dictyostelium purpureum TaxID=5786 RepID=F0ZKF3_DICPU|nr:uncharacterized protein DICPUDRAFT_78742 [Dictyostelium purpureum]EGC35583.1 hypothetical protein DICPUDRAFT_78742 [Dictyostelium purpureum]|eukprot:XP_003287886.1 hypothetical protein DICPUDRAFT_78742 [Dictyostelium purpureum]
MDFLSTHSLRNFYRVGENKPSLANLLQCPFCCIPLDEMNRNVHLFFCLSCFLQSIGCDVTKFCNQFNYLLKQDTFIEEIITRKRKNRDETNNEENNSSNSTNSNNSNIKNNINNNNLINSNSLNNINNINSILNNNNNNNSNSSSSSSSNNNNNNNSSVRRVYPRQTVVRGRILFDDNSNDEDDDTHRKSIPRSLAPNVASASIGSIVSSNDEGDGMVEVYYNHKFLTEENIKRIIHLTDDSKVCLAINCHKPVTGRNKNNVIFYVNGHVFILCETSSHCKDGILKRGFDQVFQYCLEKKKIPIHGYNEITPNVGLCALEIAKKRCYYNSPPRRDLYIFAPTNPNQTYHFCSTKCLVDLLEFTSTSSWNTFPETWAKRVSKRFSNLGDTCTIQQQINPISTTTTANQLPNNNNNNKNPNKPK